MISSIPCPVCSTFISFLKPIEKQITCPKCGAGIFLNENEKNKSRDPSNVRETAPSCNNLSLGNGESEGNAPRSSVGFVVAGVSLVFMGLMLILVPVALWFGAKREERKRTELAKVVQDQKDSRQNEEKSEDSTVAPKSGDTPAPFNSPATPPAVTKKPQKRSERLAAIPFDSIATIERLEEVKGVRIAGKAKFFDSNNVNNVVVTWESLKRLKYTEKSLGFDTTMVLIRDHGWSIKNDDVLALSDDGLTFYQNFNYAMVLSNLIPLMEEGFDIEKGEEVNVNEKRCSTVTVRRTGRPPMKLFFDLRTRLLYKAEFKGRFLDQNNKFAPFSTFVELFFSDYRVTDGINHWRKYEQWRDGRRYAEVNLGSVEFFTKLEDHQFSVPQLDQKIREVTASYRLWDQDALIKTSAARHGIGEGSDFSRIVRGLNKATPENHALLREALVTYVELSRAKQLPSPRVAEIPALLMLLKADESTDFQFFALECLQKLGPQAFSAEVPLISIARGKASPNVLLRVLATLEIIEGKSDAAKDVFQANVTHPDEEVRNRAALAMLRLAPERISNPALIDFASRMNKELSNQSIKILRQRLAAVTPKDLPFLRAGLKSSSKECRLIFIDAIGSLQFNGRDAAQDLATLLTSTDEETVRHAVRSLHRLGSLQDAVKDDPSPNVLLAAIVEMRNSEAKKIDALSFYENHLKHTDEAIRNAAASAILKFAPERLKNDQLTDLSASSDEEVRMLARKLLASKNQVFAAKVGTTKVELVEMKAGPLIYYRQTLGGLREFEEGATHVIVKVRVTNESVVRAVKFAPWHSSDGKSKVATARDDNGTKLSCWLAGPGEWPVGGIQNSRTLDPGKSVVDVVVFAVLPSRAAEIDIKLPGENVGVQGQWFEFKIARTSLKK